MKIRNDFVTNSSSSSFILRNNTSEDLTGEEFIMKLMEPILEDAKEHSLTIPAGDQIIVNCGDHWDDGAFEYFIHAAFSSFGISYVFDGDDSDVKVEFYESYH